MLNYMLERTRCQVKCDSLAEVYEVQLMLLWQEYILNAIFGLMEDCAYFGDVVSQVAAIRGNHLVYQRWFFKGYINGFMCAKAVFPHLCPKKLLVAVRYCLQISSSF